MLVLTAGAVTIQAKVKDHLQPPKDLLQIYLYHLLFFYKTKLFLLCVAFLMAICMLHFVKFKTHLVNKPIHIHAIKLTNCELGVWG
jgi:hypothetical protein